MTVPRLRRDRVTWWEREKKRRYTLMNLSAQHCSTSYEMPRPSTAYLYLILYIDGVRLMSQSRQGLGSGVLWKLLLTGNRFDEYQQSLPASSIRGIAWTFLRERPNNRKHPVGNKRREIPSFIINGFAIHFVLHRCVWPLRSKNDSQLVYYF